jgi:hypothetical protein
LETHDALGEGRLHSRMNKGDGNLKGNVEADVRAVTEEISETRGNRNAIALY